VGRRASRPTRPTTAPSSAIPTRCYRQGQGGPAGRRSMPLQDGFWRATVTPDGSARLTCASVDRAGCSVKLDCATKVMPTHVLIEEGQRRPARRGPLTSCPQARAAVPCLRASGSS
jgi:hypothetical protein